MARIFLALTGFAVLLLILNLLLGYRIGDVQEVARRVVETRRTADDLRRSLSPDPDALRAADQQVTTAAQVYRPYRNRIRQHVLVGIAASLVVILVNSITVTYFIGTARWCREVVETYGLDAQLTERSRRLKSSAFPWALIGIVTILSLIVLGALADPSTDFERSPTWVLPHHLGALSAIMIIGWSLLVQVGKIGANYEIIEEILAEVSRVRRERGLPALTDEEIAQTRLS